MSFTVLSVSQWLCFDFMPTAMQWHLNILSNVLNSIILFFVLIAPLRNEKLFLSVWCHCLSMIEGKTKTTNADRCKCYREKNAEEYKIKDASQKKQARLKLKVHKSAYEQYKKRKEKENGSLKGRESSTNYKRNNH